MNPPPVRLAYQIEPYLEGLEWAIGGSTLLYTLGLEPNPTDLDLLTTVEHFPLIGRRLTALLEPVPQPDHPSFQTAHFARFIASDGTGLDLMAGIRVASEGGVVSWTFDHARVARRDGLPWMTPEDWLTLYKLFDRRSRVAQLERYLAEASLTPVARVSGLSALNQQGRTSSGHGEDADP
ncbi:MAG: hypothetical protein SFU83_05810 [Meiothermus sp.]|nr:hypothetical protein [Meiothermus sp.]